MKNKIVYLGSKEIGLECLEFLFHNSAKLNSEIVGVHSNNRTLNDSKNKTIAQFCIDNKIHHYKNLDEILEENQIDFIISIQYHQILKPNHILKAKKLAINLHMAPLPEYRGCNQFSFSIIDDKKEFGTTIHRLEPKIDGGDIIAEDRFHIPNEIFVKELNKLTNEKSISLFRSEIGNIISGNYQLKSQQTFNERTASFHLRNEIEDLKRIQHNWDVEKQKKYFRATYFPPFSPPVLVLENGQEKELDMEWYNSLK